MKDNDVPPPDQNAACLKTATERDCFVPEVISGQLNSIRDRPGEKQKNRENGKEKK